jgi:thymidylate synthase
MHLVINDMKDGYRELIDFVVENGKTVSPRGQETREIVGASFELTNPYESLPWGINRNFGKGIAAAEALQLIGGVSHPALMAKLGQNFPRFQDGGTFHGAYGPRLRQQLPRVVDRLEKDPDTRQAIANIWDPALDLPEDGLRDYPCTLNLHFMVRDGRLVLCTTMRSNDVWWGLAHDVFQFTQLQLTVATALRIPPGAYHHRANSLHVYTRDLEAISKLTSYRRLPGMEYTPAGIDVYHSDAPTAAERFREAAETARALLDNSSQYGTADEVWYRKAIGHAAP